MNRFTINDCDKNSINGDPHFVDPSMCDFRLTEGSPALKSGFVNFPMNQFGVTKPSLKVIAKIPEIPVITIQINEEKGQVSKQSSVWVDMQLKEPAGDELSAFGVSFDSGGVALTAVAENSAAAKLGFRNGDLIQSINGFRIKDIQNLKQYIETKKGGNQHVFTIIRNQGKIKITVNQLLSEVSITVQ